MAGILAIGLLGSAIRIPPTVSGSVLLVLAVVFLVTLLRRLDFGRKLILVVLGGLAVYLGYLSYTDPTQRNPDALDQLAYIQFIAHRGTLPPSDHCFICHHPPLYFVLAALWLRSSSWTQLASPGFCLQVLSLSIFLVFVVFAILTVKLFRAHPALVQLGAAVIVFWPTSIIGSVRVHNDTLSSALIAMAIYFTVKWHQKSSSRDLYWAAAACGLSILTKSSGYAVAFCLIVLLVWKLFRRDRTMVSIRQFGVALTTMVVCVGLGIFRRGGGRVSWCHRLAGQACDAIGMGNRQGVPNGPFNYLYFDVHAFLAEPFQVGDRPSTGTPYFWNSLLKTSLFGNHAAMPDPEFGHRVNAWLATVIGFLLLAMVTLVVIGAISVTRKQARGYGILWLFVGAFVVSLAGFRALIPVANHADFRNVFPLLVPATLLFTQSLERFRRQGRALNVVGYAVAIAFILLSVLFFAPKQALVRKLTAVVVERPLSSLSTIRPSGTPLNQVGNWFMNPDHILEFRTPADTVVSRLDVSLDRNDQYEVDVVGKRETRRLILGPNLGAGTGLVRYQESIHPPVVEVQKITVQPIQGDGDYAIGHLVIGADAGSQQ